jgi:hypothetical protein
MPFSDSRRGTQHDVRSHVADGHHAAPRGSVESIVDEFLAAIKANVEKAGVFKDVKINSLGVLQCAAKDAAEPAWYRIDKTNGAWNVSLVTANRWLSESIEADLMHYGDPIEELIEEELVELGFKGKALPVKHYRSDDLLYTFLSPLPIKGSEDKNGVGIATQCLLAYEAAFRELGDMGGGGEE